MPDYNLNTLYGRKYLMPDNEGIYDTTQGKFFVSFS